MLCIYNFRQFKETTIYNPFSYPYNIIKNEIWILNFTAFYEEIKIETYI